MYQVLLVDDEAIILEGFQKIIDWDDLGLEIKDSALSGTQALKLLRQNSYDIVITDVYMKDITGLELLNYINEENIPVKSIIISGYDKFDYVKRALSLGIENYLLKPVNEDELVSTLLNTIDKLNQDGTTRELNRLGSDALFGSVIYRWMTSRIEYDELKARAELLGININRKYYGVVVIKRYSGEASPVSPFPLFSMHQLELQTKRMLKDAVSCGKDLSDVYVTLTPNNFVLLVIGLDFAPDYNEMYSKLKLLLSKLLNIEDRESDFFACIGAFKEGREGAPKSYVPAVRALSYALVMPPNSIIAYDDMRNRRNDLYDKHKINLKVLSGLLASAYDEHTAERCINAIRTILGEIKSKAITPNELYCFIAEMVFRIFGTIQLKGISGAPESDDRDLLNIIMGMQTIDEVEKWLTDMVKKHIASKYDNNHETRRIVKKIINHIMCNYCEDMSLKSLSYSFNLNPAYLGQIFKDETGSLFTDYLCNVRIEHAKRLLTETNMKTGEISVMVGFRNANYFSNVFRKKTGCYPTMYREKSI